MLQFEGVTKFYGAVIGLNDVSFALRPGITGLLGSNGAGKSTLLKLASGQLRPSQGQVFISGKSAWSSGARQRLGYCPDVNRFYEEMSGREFVFAMARLHGFSRTDARSRTETALAEVGMTDRAGRRLGGCSHGMRQRIKLAQALVHDPDLLLLDEPLSGIDPGGRREINQLLKQLAERGKTVLVSSHILHEIEQLADSVIMLARGRLVAAGSLADIRRALENRPATLEIAAEPLRRLASLLAGVADVQGVDIRSEAVIVRTQAAPRLYAQIAEWARAGEIDVQRMQLLDSGAEAVFGYLQS